MGKRHTVVTWILHGWWMTFGLALVIRPALGMDLVRQETRVDAAVREFGVSGRGVIVAILDRGIDWSNGDFRHDDGSTRLAYIFDLTDDRGAAAPGNSYEMGTIYDRDQINAALAGRTRLATRDAVGHGTTTTGIACGNGRNSPDRKYRGIAPDAAIISVKITSDGAPAHDNEPAETFFWRAERVPVAIDFVRDKAKELGMPCVMLLNVGSQGGPTDGTSDLCRKIDDTVGPDHPGLVFVTGPGDEGTNRKHQRTVIFQKQRVPVGTIWDGASARFNICPGDYVIRTEWIDVDGFPRSHADEGSPGEIWRGSSIGPTADGRMGIDVCAPGDSLFTTYNPRSYWATVRGNLVRDGGGLYGRASAVSASAPIVTGIVALMLEKDPQLDAAQIKEILQQTARTDGFTGRVPNIVWGYGKVDAYAALSRVVRAKRPGRSERPGR